MRKVLPKYKHLRDVLESAIRSGEFGVGAKLPGERDLARLYGMSHMTARRAVGELVESELLERRPGSGIYVRPRSRERLSSITLHLVCSAIDGSIAREFLRHATQQASTRGWQISITRLLQGHERSIARAISAGEPALVLYDETSNWLSMAPAMQSARSRAVCVGSRMDSDGVPSVLADDARAIRLAVEHLRGAGHRRIALLSGHGETAVERVQIAVWRKSMESSATRDEIESDFLVAPASSFDSRVRLACDTIRTRLQNGTLEATALLCLDDEMAFGALAGCREAGKRVPDDFSLINSGDSTMLEFSSPPVTVIDVDIAHHVTLAMQLLEKRLQESLRPDEYLRLVEPHLVERSSVAAPRDT